MGQPQQNPAENPVVCLPHKALGERQRDPGITLHDIAVVQYDRRIRPAQRGDGACLENMDLSVLDGKLDIPVPVAAVPAV